MITQVADAGRNVRYNFFAESNNNPNRGKPVLLANLNQTSTSATRERPSAQSREAVCAFMRPRFRPHLVAP